MGLKGFLLSSDFIDGGVTGISMLLAKTTGAAAVGAAAGHQSAVRRRRLPAARARLRGPQRAGHRRPCRGARDRAISRRDARPVLTAVFGGFFIGAGIGLAVRGGAVLDGTEIAALLISKRSRSAQGRRRDPRLQRRAVPGRDVGRSASSRRSIRSSPIWRRRRRSTSSCTASTSTRRSRSCRRRPRASASASPPTSAAASRSTRATAA